MDIIKRNFLLLIRNGAFGEEGAPEPMSRYKWSIMHSIADVHGVHAVINKATGEPYSQQLQQLPDAGLSHLSNHWLNRRLKKIRTTEPTDPEASLETLNMLDILVRTAEGMMTHGFSYADIVSVGTYMRKEGDKVDFVKLDIWLKRLCIARMAQLIGSILIEALGFEKDEVPFVSDIEVKAMPMAIQALENPTHIKTEDLEFHQGNNIFVTGNSKAMMQTVRNSMRFFFFAPLEAASCLMHSFLNGLANIEE